MAADAWDFGPGNQSSESLTFQDFATAVNQFANTAVQTVGTVTGAVNNITQSLGGAVSPAQTSTQPTQKPGVPWWIWAIGGYLLIREMK